MYVSSLVVILDQAIKANCGPKAINLGKGFLFVTVFFIGEEWLSLLTLLKTGLSSKFFFEKLAKI